MSGTDPASASTSLAWSMRFRLSRSHVTAAPAMATEPSSAYCRGVSGPSWNATVVRRPCVEGTTTSPVLSNMKHPVP